jgi:dTMP kinase
MPDQTLVFDCPYEVSRSRLGASGRVLDRFEAEERDFFDRVRKAYQDLAKAEPGRVRIIDGSQVEVKVKDEVKKYLIYS